MTIKIVCSHNRLQPWQPRKVKNCQGSTGGNNNDLKLTLKTKQCNYERGIICATEGWLTDATGRGRCRCWHLVTRNLIMTVVYPRRVWARRRPCQEPHRSIHASREHSPHLTSTTSIVLVLFVVFTRVATLSLLFLVTQIRLYSFSIVCQLDLDQGHTKKYTLRVDINILFCISRSELKIK